MKGIENQVKFRVRKADTMSYQLPGLDETWVEYIGQATILFRNFDGRPGFISIFREVLDHKEAHRRHTAAVRRFLLLRLIWNFGGKYLPFARTELLRAIEV